MRDGPGVDDGRESSTIPKPCPRSQVSPTFRTPPPRQPALTPNRSSTRASSREREVGVARRLFAEDGNDDDMMIATLPLYRPVVWRMQRTLSSVSDVWLWEGAGVKESETTAVHCQYRGLLPQRGRAETHENQATALAGTIGSYPWAFHFAFWFYLKNCGGITVSCSCIAHCERQRATMNALCQQKVYLCLVLCWDGTSWMLNSNTQRWSNTQTIWIRPLQNRTVGLYHRDVGCFLRECLFFCFSRFSLFCVVLSAVDSSC